MAAPSSEWKVDRLASVATWGEYRIKFIPQSEGSRYWAYGPGGQFLGTGWGKDVTDFKALCEQHAASRK